MDYYRIGRDHFFWIRPKSTLHVNVQASIINVLDQDYLEKEANSTPDLSIDPITKAEFNTALDIVAFSLELTIRTAS